MYIYICTHIHRLRRIFIGYGDRGLSNQNFVNVNKNRFVFFTRKVKTPHSSQLHVGVFAVYWKMSRFLRFFKNSFWKQYKSHTCGKHRQYIFIYIYNNSHVRGLLFKFVDILYKNSACRNRIMKVISSETVINCL